MRGIPQTLPPGLYEAAARRGRPSVGSRPGLDVPPVPAIPKQFTGPQRTQSPINRQQFGSPVSAQSTGGDWLVTPQEKAQFDNIFVTVDTAKMGMISGDQAVSFFMNAQLPEETLAQIWDLADIDADGQLTRDEFAVAMYLVRQQRAGKEPLPQVLPPALIPPSMRRQVPREAAPAAPAPAPPAPQPPSAADDLFGLDAFTAPPPPAAPSQVPQSTGGSNPPFRAPGSPSSRQSPSSPSTTFKPFVPTSSFGQSLQPQATGTQPAAPAQSPPPDDDLLGDADPEESKKLTQETTELANLSNQIGSLANEMQNVQAKRTSAEQNLSQTSQQKRDFEARLAQARTMYEEEVKSFKALEERLNASKAETSKLQQEYAMIDGSRQDLQNQYDQVSAALAADQQENGSLKEKIREANAAVAQLKPALEKARSSGRQQKGLVAINKKQLATVEGERDKIQEEISGTPQEPPEPSESPAPEAGGVRGTSSPAPEATRVASPAASTTSQNTNPFFKRTVTGSSDNALSPQVSNDHQRAFESFFGPSLASPSATTPPPPTSFRSESPAVQQPSSKAPSVSGAGTPSVSPPPSNIGGGAEPPAPPQSRQVTPSALPLGGTQSATSSTMVSPPGSRFGGADTSDFGTPAPTGASELGGPTVTGVAPAQSPFDEVQESSARFPEIPETATDESGKPVSPADDEKQSKDPSFDELFGGPARQRSPSQKANDFDEAFASMKPSGGDKTNGTSPAADNEFPPIREFEDDDESTDSEGPMGFEDNFSPAAPAQSQSETRNNSIDASQLAAFPALGTAAVAGQPSAAPPTAEAQRSPPKYDESVSKGEGDVPEFNGLVPRRSDPTLSPGGPHSLESSTGAPVVGGEPQYEGGNAAPTATAASNNGKPDFEAAFAGLDLAPAKEAEDDDDEGIHESKNPDFDFSFDTPSQQRAAPSNPQGSSDFFNFDNNVRTPSPGTAAQPSTSPAAKTPEHDWDALFAPLDNPTAPGGWPNGSSNTESAPPSSNDKKEPGWALSAGSGNDDQILQRLTGMGFPREESLSALEKFDYNIDKVDLLPLTSINTPITRLTHPQAVDFLTSKS